MSEQTTPEPGQIQCPTCGKWVWRVLHSCKGVRVAPAAQEASRTVEDAARAWPAERRPMEDDTHAAVARHTAVEGAVWQAARMPSAEEVAQVLAGYLAGQHGCIDAGVSWAVSPCQACMGTAARSVDGLAAAGLLATPEHDAQVASAEFVPSTGQVRNRYAAGRRALDARDACLSPAVLEAEFDAWLDEHDAQVSARAWGEGYGAGLSKGLDIAERAGTPVVSKILPPPRNPYRIERQEGER